MAKPTKPRIPADIGRVGELLVEASKISKHKEFVIIGSLSVLASPTPAPPQMLMSVDVDFYPRQDPGRAGEIVRELGHDSKFMERKGLYADAVSPHLAALPDGWEDRLQRVEHPEGVVGFYLEANDCAVAKLARNQQRDKQWVREGIAAGIIDPGVVEHRMKTAPFLDQAEHAKAVKSLHIQADLAKARSRGKSPTQ